MPQPDITVIVNGHREGLLATASLRSAARAIERATTDRLEIEVFLILDRADPLTLEVFSTWKAGRNATTLLQVDHGDLGKSRNSGVAAGSGKWVAFLDADDLWGENWLVEALAAAEKDPRQVVWHPATNLYFGERPHIFTHVDMEDEEFNIAILALTNPWTALCFAKRSLLLGTPYMPTAHARQIGYEDWGWNMDTIAKGAIHKVVPGTAHAVRTKSISLLGQTTAAACLPHPSGVLRDILVAREQERASAFPGTGHAVLRSRKVAAQAGEIA